MMNNKVFKSLAAMALIAAPPAYSGGYVAPIFDTPILSPISTSTPVLNWTGPYAGIYFARNKFDVKATHELGHEAITIEHEAITEDTPAIVVEHPAVTEERVIEVIQHPEKKELVQIGSEKVQIGTESVIVREDVYFDESGAKQRDESHPTGWRHVPVYEERPVLESRPVFEERVVQEAWAEEIVEVVVVEEARTEVVRPAESIIVREAWTEVVRSAWTERLIEEFGRNGQSYGIFAGYRYQWRNNLVAGIEAHYGRNEASEFHVGGEAVSFGKDSFGIEAQAGLAIKRALPYLAVGYSNVLDSDATTLSIGLDYAITNRVLFGARYSHHDLGEIKGGGMRRFEADGNSISLRTAIRF